MNALLELRKQMEIDFLKTKTYEEINDMFNQLNDKLKLAESEVKKFRLGDVSNRRELYFAFMKEYNSLMGESEHQILKEEVEVLLAKYSC